MNTVNMCSVCKSRKAGKVNPELTCFTGTSVQMLTQTEELRAGTQFPCFTGTKVQMLTQKEELRAGSSSFAETQALASGGGGGGGEGGAAAAAGIAASTQVYLL